METAGLGSPPLRRISMPIHSLKHRSTSALALLPSLASCAIEAGRQGRGTAATWATRRAEILEPSREIGHSAGKKIWVRLWIEPWPCVSASGRF
jgi:hypothetical protein